jgi:uncharacterized protein (UPF0297 family)
MTTFQIIVKQAVKGVISGTAPLAEIDLKLKDAFQKIEQTEPANDFLSRAITTYYFELSGYTPKKTQSRLSKAPQESKTWISGKVQNVLHQIYGEDLDDYEPEFFCLMKKHGQILTPEFLPPYLDKLYRGKIEKELLTPIIGERGLWLCKQNESWQKLFEEPELNREAWDYGKKEERLRYIKKLREKEPGSALNLIKDAWKKEKTKTKLDFLETLEININQEDEEFLHSLWKEGAKDLSSLAIKLLAKIPNSEYVRQQKDFLKQIFSVKKEFLKGKKVKLEENYELLNLNADLVPNNLNKEQKWDLDDWFTQLICLVDLDFWAELVQEDEVEKIIDLLEKSSKNRTVWTRGLSVAAKRQQRRDWAKILFAKFASVIDPIEEGRFIVNLLDTKDISQIIKKEFSNLNSQGYNPVLQLIANSYRPSFESEHVEKEAALLMIKYLLRQTDIKDKYYYYKREPSKDLSKWIKVVVNPNIKEEIESLIETKVKSSGKEISEGHFEHTLQILEIRHKMHRAFNLN